MNITGSLRAAEELHTAGCEAGLLDTSPPSDSWLASGLIGSLAPLSLSTSTFHVASTKSLARSHRRPRATLSPARRLAFKLRKGHVRLPGLLGSGEARGLGWCGAAIMGATIQSSWKALTKILVQEHLGSV